MSALLVSSQLEKSFAADVRQRGETYYLTGRVKLLNGDDFECDAAVKGSQSYDVYLVIEDDKPDTLFCYCSCPYAFDVQQPCKHIWATIRAATAKGWLCGYPNYLVRKATLSRAAYDEDFDDDDGPPPRDFRRPTISSNKPHKPPSKPDWQKRVESINAPTGQYVRPTSADWASRRELLYVIESPPTVNSALTVQLMHRERKANGEWSKPKSGAPSRDEIKFLSDAIDREITATLHGADQFSGYSQCTFHLDDTYTRFLLPRMLQTGRSLLKSAYPAKDYVPVQWDDGPAWRFSIDVASDDRKSYRLSGVLERDSQRLAPRDVRAIANNNLLLLGDRFARLDIQGAPGWLQLFRQQAELVIPAKEFDRFLSVAFTRPELPPLNLPQELSVTMVTEQPRPVLHIAPNQYGYSARDQLEAEVKFRYGETEVATDDHTGEGYDVKSRTLRRRDRAAEQKFIARLGQTRLRRRTNYSYGYASQFYLASKDLPELARNLVAEGWTVEAEGKLFRTAGKFEMNVASGIDWFELQGNVDFDGQSVALPKILAAVRKQQTTVDLADGTIGMLPDEWLKKYGLLASVGNAEDGHVRFARNQVGLLDALLAAQPDVNFDAAFRKAREEFQNFRGVEAAEPPDTFCGQLRPYQNDGLGWLQFLRKFGFGGCLADDMGLGKTVQVLAMLADRAATRKKSEPRPSLVVVPKSLIFNWIAEAKRFAPTLAVLDHTGKERGKDVESLKKYDVVLTTYGTMRNDAAMLQDAEFDYCILDESQAVKNVRTESAKAVRLLRCRNRLAMSGTPIENHLGELWSLFDLLNPGMLGHSAAFTAISGAGRNPDPESRGILSQALRPFILRRTKDQVAKDLPQKTEQTVYCDLDEKQRRVYDDLREYYRQALLTRIDTQGMAKSKIQVLEALLRLRQAACHPALLDKKLAEDSSAKLDVLMPRLQEVFEEGHKALVFSQFTSFLSLVKKRLDATGVPYEYLDGKTRDRQERVEKFQTDPKCQLFLISLKAGGVGLNLTAAEYVFLLDPWWNPAVEAQAIDRTHRIGQTRPVFAYRIIARDTVEEKVLALQATKRDLADAIINADNSLIRSLKKEDLELLLS